MYFEPVVGSYRNTGNAAVINLFSGCGFRRKNRRVLVNLLVIISRDLLPFPAGRDVLYYDFSGRDALSEKGDAR